MTHAEDRYYVPHGSHWPVVGSAGLFFMMLGVSIWLNGTGAGFWVMMTGVAIVVFMLTGWFRDGCCRSGPGDSGLHLVCAEMTTEFLAFSKARGNDLTAPMPAAAFPGLKPGDRWCLCALRWKEALDAGVAPPVVLEATHERALQVVLLDELRAHAVGG